MPIKNIFGFRKKKKVEGDIVIDNSDIKVVSVTYEGKQLLIGVGTTEEGQREVEAGLGEEGVKGKYLSQKALKWKIFYDQTVLPNMMPLENFKAFAASTIAVTSGSLSVLDATTQFKEENPENFKRLENKLQKRAAQDLSWLEGY
jgi:hypothetical protein